MFRSYLKIAFRTFQKNKLISFINIFGLGLSMSVGMMIMVRLQDQLTYDNFHPKPERTYRIISEYKKNTGEAWKMASTPLPLNEKLQRDVSGIESSVNIYPSFGGKVLSSGQEIYLNGAFTEPSFFKVFGFALAAGDPVTALEKPNSIVITRNTAEKYFGTENPIGKVFTLETGENFIITGVLNEISTKSHIDYDAYASFSSVQQMEKDKRIAPNSSNWSAFNVAYTYVVLKDGFTEGRLIKDLNAISAELNKDNKEGAITLSSQAIGKITPGTDRLSNDIGRGTSWTKLYFEIGVSLIILLAACFNYTNLTVARALTRAKEVGIRKVAGAKRSQIFIQYIVESVLLALLALVFAWLLLSLIIRFAPFNDDYEFIPSSFRYNTSLFLWSAGFAIFTGLLAGLSPAWILSSFKPLRVLKNLKVAKIMGKISLQKTLIVFQYSLSLTIIIFLLAFYKQFSHMAKADPGFKKENVMIVPLKGMDERIAAQKIATLSGVQGVSAMSSLFNKHFSGMTTPVWRDNKKDAISLNYYFANKPFIENMDLKFVAGNNFQPPTEKQEERSIIINEQAAMALGLKDYQKAIGQSVWIDDSTKLEIAGVLKNFTYENAGSPVRALAFRTRPGTYSYLYINADNTDKQALTERVIGSLKALAPSQTFTSSWLDEDLAKNNSQTATISLLGYLAFMAIAIASLGLLGLVTYTVEVKRKEISVRKIIGASEKQLVTMLSRGFIKLLFIAGFIAMPLGYIAGFLFLQNFADRANFGLSTAIFSFLLLLAIGLITVVSQTYKAATANPAKDLRME
jgi:putative ABC transport system permease protein